MNETKNQNILSLINSANSIAIIPSRAAGGDSFGAALGIYRLLKSTSTYDHTEVKILHIGEKPSKFLDAEIPEGAIVDNVRRKDLIVSIDYSNTPASKVSYATHNDILRLKISPIDDNFNLDRVTTVISNFNYDLALVIGASSLSDLGLIYQAAGEELRNKPVINFDIMSNNKFFGKENVIDTGHKALSSLILQSFVELGFIIETKAAEAFLLGITARSAS